jgi:hypothetical protein
LNTDDPGKYCQHWDTDDTGPTDHGHISMSVQCGYPAVTVKDNLPACIRHGETDD